jgi:hypothetical protein
MITQTTHKDRLTQADGTRHSAELKSRDKSCIGKNGNGKANHSAPKKSPPNGGKKPFSMTGLPTPSWTERQLVEGARFQCSEMQAAERKAAVHVFRLGAALIILKPLMKKRRSWGKFLKDLHLSEATAWRATELFARAKTEDQVALLPITDAYEKFGIIQTEMPKDDDGDPKKGKGAETGGKKKSVSKKSTAKKVKAKKTLPKDAKDAADKDAQEEEYEKVEQDEEDDDFDSGELFEEVAKRNGWDFQKQVQTMVDYWGTDALGTLLMDVADAADFKEFLTEQETLSPPKEPNSPLSVLVMLGNRLNLLASEIKAVDWAKESAADYLERLDQLMAAVEELRKAVPHA